MSQFKPQYSIKIRRVVCHGAHKIAGTLVTEEVGESMPVQRRVKGVIIFYDRLLHRFEDLWFLEVLRHPRACLLQWT
jgi:hypothetical protein